MQIVRLAQQFASSRFGKICGWVCAIQMALLASSSLVNVVLRRFSGEPIGLIDAILLSLTIFGANACRIIFSIFDLSIGPRAKRS